MPPVVPYQREVELRPSDRQGIDVQSTPDMFGAAQARGMGQIARGLDSAASAYDAVRDLDAMNIAKGGQTDWQRALQEKNYGPNGYFTKQGKDAVEAYPAWKEENEKLRQQFRPTDPIGAKKYDDATIPYQTGLYQQGVVHQAQQRRTWTNQESGSRLKLFSDQAATLYNNPQQLKVITASALAEVDENARLNGYDADTVKLKKLEVTSGISKNVIARYIQDGNTKAASDYLSANRTTMSANDIYETEGVLKPAQQLAEAQSWASKILTDGGAKPAAPNQTPTFRGDGLPPPETISRQWVPRQDSGPFAFMVRRVENQAGDTGAVSSAGALGLAQVMPGTAREQAKKLGMNDVAGMGDAQLRKHFAAHPEDNLKIGEAYYMDQRQRYGGDDKAAVIAYNAGPGVADKWIAGGRDDSMLPKETQNYVLKVFGGDGVRRRGRGGQANDQLPDMSKPAGFQGDQFEFLKSRSNHSNSVYGLKPDFAANLAAMIQDAPPEIRDNLTLASDYRDSGVQAANYAKSDGSGKMVARPGGSSHEFGLAADLGWKGGDIRSVPPEVKRWLHTNAARYNLNFRMSWEDWHIEPADARQRIASGAAGAASAPGARGGLTRDSIDWAGPTFTGAPITGTVTQGRSGMSYRSRMPSLDQINAQLNAIPDPVVRQKALQLINSQLSMASAADEADHKAAKQELWNWVDAGNSVASVPPDLRSRLAMEDMSAAFNYEDARAKGPTINDDQNLVYNMRRFAAADPAAFAGVDLMQYRDRVSQQTMKELTDTQTKYISDPASAQKDGVEVDAAMKQAEPYIQAMGYGSQGKTGTELQEAKKQEIQARLALMQQIQAYKIANNGRSPTYMDVEGMLQTLSRPVVFQNAQGGNVEAGYFGGAPNRFVFQGRNRPDGSFMVGSSSYDQIPTDLRRHITDRLATRLGRQPSQVEVAAAYNDFSSRENPGANPADYPQQGPPMPTAPAGVQPQVPAPAATPPGVVPPPQATGADGPAPAVYQPEQAVAPESPQVGGGQPPAGQPTPFIMSTTLSDTSQDESGHHMPSRRPWADLSVDEQAQLVQDFVNRTSDENAKAGEQATSDSFSQADMDAVRAELEKKFPRAVIRESDVIAELRKRRQ